MKFFLLYNVTVIKYVSFLFSFRFSVLRPIPPLTEKTIGVKLPFLLDALFCVVSVFFVLIHHLVLLEAFALVPPGVWVKNPYIKKCHLVLRCPETSRTNVCTCIITHICKTAWKVYSCQLSKHRFSLNIITFLGYQLSCYIAKFAETYCNKHHPLCKMNCVLNRILHQNCILTIVVIRATSIWFSRDLKILVLKISNFLL